MKDKAKSVIRYLITNMIYTAIIFVVYLLTKVEYLKHTGFHCIIVNWDYIVTSYFLLIIILTLIDIVNYYRRDRTRNVKE